MMKPSIGLAVSLARVPTLVIGTGPAGTTSTQVMARYIAWIASRGWLATPGRIVG